VGDAREALAARVADQLAADLAAVLSAHRRGWRGHEADTGGTFDVEPPEAEGGRLDAARVTGRAGRAGDTDFGASATVELDGVDGAASRVERLAHVQAP
jgi:hypothetical protein